MLRLNATPQFPVVVGPGFIPAATLLIRSDVSPFSLHLKVEAILVLAHLDRVRNGAVSGAPMAFRPPTR